MTLMVLGVRHGRSGSTPNGGAARSVSNHHAVTIELGYQFSIRSFAAACAGTGELKQRLFELAALNGVFIHRVGLCRDLLDAIFPSIFQMFLGSKRHHDKGFFLSRASVYAVAAALAVHGETIMRKCRSLAPTAGLVVNSAGAAFTSSSFRRTGRIAACGQT